METPKCRICGNTIRKWTANKYKDWDERKAHKTCWREEQQLKEFMKWKESLIKK